MDRYESRLDDSVKLLLVVMSILYSTTLTLQLKMQPASYVDYIMFGFPVLSVVPFAIGNLFSGAIERAMKTLSIYFVILSLGFFPLVILSSASPPLVDSFWYGASGALLASFSFVGSIMSVIYAQGNLRFIGTRFGISVLIIESFVTFVLLYEMLGLLTVVLTR